VYGGGGGGRRREEKERGQSKRFTNLRFPVALRATVMTLDHATTFELCASCLLTVSSSLR